MCLLAEIWGWWGSGMLDHVRFNHFCLVIHVFIFGVEGVVEQILLRWAEYAWGSRGRRCWVMMNWLVWGGLEAVLRGLMRLSERIELWRGELLRICLGLCSAFSFVIWSASAKSLTILISSFNEALQPLVAVLKLALFELLGSRLRAIRYTLRYFVALWSFYFMLLPVVSSLLLVEWMHALGEAGHPSALGAAALFWSLWASVIHVHHHHGVKRGHWITVYTRLSKGNHTELYREEAHRCVGREHEVRCAGVVVQAAVTCARMLLGGIRYVLWRFLGLSGFLFRTCFFLVDDDIVCDIVDVVSAITALRSHWSFVLVWHLWPKKRVIAWRELHVHSLHWLFGRHEAIVSLRRFHRYWRSESWLLELNQRSLGRRLVLLVFRV